MPILQVSHTRIKSATCESQIIEKQAIKTKYEQGTEIHATVLGVRKLGHNIILECQKELLQAKVDCRPHVIRLGRSKDKITNNSPTPKVQLMGCEIKQIQRMLNKFKSTFSSKRVRFKTEKNLYKKLRNKCQDKMCIRDRLYICL